MPSHVQPLRRSYMLRLWRAGNGDAPQWRLSLEDTQTHTLRGFEDLAGLVTFLETQLGQLSPAHEQPEQDSAE